MVKIMTIKLNEPGMTSLHKVGLAGLYMTLSAFDEFETKIPGLEWELSPKAITLHWQDEKLGFENLIKQSFQLDQNGFIRLPGLEVAGQPKPDQLHHLHTALLASFLQFGPHRSVASKKPLTYEIDSKLYWIKEFAPITKYQHQKAPEFFLDTKGKFITNIEIGGWLYPGGAQRHVQHSNTKLEEPMCQALALLFAPIGCIYFTIISAKKKKKARLALIIPEVKDLEAYSEMRQNLAALGIFDLTASSATDATLRMIAHNMLQAKSIFATLDKIPLCRIITFGIVSWSEKQKTRTDAYTILPTKLVGLQNYYQANAIFKNRWQKVAEKADAKGNKLEPEHYFLTTFCMRGFIADNIALNKPWYYNLANYINSNEIHKQLLYEQKEITEMVEKACFDEENERIFINACHEAWRRKLGQLGKRDNTVFSSLAEKEAVKLRVSISRCKNAHSLRETIVDFWARAGSIPILQGDGLTKILPLFSEQNWRKARDLALLALISYKSPDPQTSNNNQVLPTTTPSNEETQETEERE